MISTIDDFTPKLEVDWESTFNILIELKDDVPHVKAILRENYTFSNWITFMERGNRDWKAYLEPYKIYKPVTNKLVDCIPNRGNTNWTVDDWIIVASKKIDKLESMIYDIKETIY